MNEQLRLLIEIQEIDKVIGSLNKRKKSIPEQIEKIRNFIEEEKKKVEQSKKELSQLQIERKNKEIDLDVKEQTIRKHLTELNLVKTNEAYRALLAEIEKSKIEKSQVEDDILEFMEKIENLTLGIKGMEKETREKEEKSTEEIRTLEEELANVSEELTKEEDKRKGYLEKISPSLFNRYERIREIKEGLAVVPIEEGYCGGCRMLLPPHLINEVYKNQTIITCEICSRILYLPILLTK